MADWTDDWTAEGGSDGANVTIANSGTSGPAISVLVINAASTPGGSAAVQYSAAAASIGSLGVRITPQTSSTYQRWNISAAGRFGVRRKIRLTGTPTATATFATIRGAGDVGLMGDLRVDSANKILVADATGILTASVFTLTNLTTYYAEMFVTKGTGTTDGRIELYLYAADGTTLLWSYDSGATRNTGTLDAGVVRIGGVTSASGLTADDIDGIRWGERATGTLGAPANAAPSVTVSATQNVAAGATVNVTSTATDSDGTIASRVWTFDYPASGAPALTGATSASASFTAGAAGSLYILRHTVTDNGGATSFATTEVRVPSSATSVRHLPVDGTGTGTWTKVGGLTTDGATLNDELDTTYIESGVVSATEQRRRVRLAPMSARSSLTVPERVWQDVAGASTAKFRLYEGGTLRQEWPITLTTSPQTFTLGLSTPGAISDWGNLSLELAVTS